MVLLYYSGAGMIGVVCSFPGEGGVQSPANNSPPPFPSSYYCNNTAVAAVVVVLGTGTSIRCLFADFQLAVEEEK